jgi:hypothetical protein
LKGRSGLIIEETLDVFPDPPETPYYLDVYYDRVFETLAFKEQKQVRLLQLTAKHSNKCLDVAAVSPENGASVIQMGLLGRR